MIKFQRVQGVSVQESSGLPAIAITPEGRAMGAIPGWQLLVDPAYVSPSRTTVLNRAVPSTSMSPSNAFPEDREFSNGEPALERREGDSSMFMSGIGSKVSINPNAWTFFFVVEIDDDGVHDTPFPKAVIGNLSAAAEPGGISLYINYTGSSNAGNNINISDMRSDFATETRLSYNANLRTLGRPSLIMCTFSTRHGLSIYQDGAKVAESPEDTRPLTIGLSGDEMGLLFDAGGRHGMLGLLNIDLNAPENTGHRRAIERFLMAKYDIPEGPQ